MWPLSPLSEMWGIGRQTEQSLNSMSIFLVGDLANVDLKTLENRFGIMGNQLYHHAWGIDLSKIGEAPLIESQVLMWDYYTKKEVLAVLLEMCEDVARSFSGRTCYYTNDTMVIYCVCQQILNEHYNERPLLHISVRITKLESEHSMQLSLFDGGNGNVENLKPLWISFERIMALLHYYEQFLIQKQGTSIKRSKLIGGHKK